MTQSIPTTPDEMLADLLFALMDGREPAVTTREWFTRHTLRALRRDEPLDQALGLTNPSGGASASLSRRLRLLRRDEFLALALDAVALDDGLGLWTRCVRLADEIARFKRTEWVATRYLPRAPEHWPVARAMVWQALRCDVGIPETAKGLYGAFRARGACFEEQRGATLLGSYIV